MVYLTGATSFTSGVDYHAPIEQPRNVTPVYKYSGGPPNKPCGTQSGYSNLFPTQMKAFLLCNLELPLLQISIKKNHQKFSLQQTRSRLVKAVMRHKTCFLHRMASALGGLATAPGTFSGDEVSRKEYWLLVLHV